MTIKRYIEAWLKETLPLSQNPGDSALPENGPPQPNNQVEQLPGFNKLVRGRHGVFIANENDVYIGRALIHYGEFSEIEWDLLRQLCNPGAVVIDVGANIGLHTVSFGKAVGPDGRVIAIEPQPVIFQALCANLALNCLTNVDVFNCGCGNRPHTLRVPRIDYAQERNFGGISLQGYDAALSSIPIEVKQLDDLLRPYEKVDFLKIDVEGMEAEVIEGGAGVISNFRPVMYVENDRPPKSKNLIELIGGLGYRIWWHVPSLFNPRNYFGNSHNIFSNFASFNMLCIHSTMTSNICDGLEEVKDSSYHPAAG